MSTAAAVRSRRPTRLFSAWIRHVGLSLRCRSWRWLARALGWCALSCVLLLPACRWATVCGWVAGASGLRAFAVGRRAIHAYTNKCTVTAHATAHATDSRQIREDADGPDPIKLQKVPQVVAGWGLSCRDPGTLRLPAIPAVETGPPRMSPFGPVWPRLWLQVIFKACFGAIRTS